MTVVSIAPVINAGVITFEYGGIMNGIIFYEDGTVQLLGTITTMKIIAQAAPKVIADLVRQERQQVLASITDDELKHLIDAKADRDE